MQTTQTPNLPIQISGASASPSQARANQGGGADPSQFSQALSREIVQRQNSSAPAKQQAPQADKGVPPKQAAKEPTSAAEAASPATTPGLSQPKPAGKADASAEQHAEDAAAATPMADMLALMASFNLPPQTSVASVAEAPAAAIAGAAAVSSAAVPATAAAGALPGSADSLADASAQSMAVAAAPRMPVDAQAVAEAVPAPHAAAFTLPDAVKRAQAPDPLTQAAPRAPALPAQAAPRTEATSAAAALLARGPAAAAATSVAPALPAEAGTIKTESLASVPHDSAAPLAVPERAAPTAQADPGHHAAQAAVPAAAPAALREATLADAPETVSASAAITDVQGASAPLSSPLQQAAMGVAQAANPAATDKIAARVGTPGWDNQVGQKIVWMVAGKEQSASLTLNPPDMGPMQVVLSVTNDQASVTFTAAQPEVRQALENAMPKLREMMEESGIALGNATVNAGQSDQRQAQGEQARQGGAGPRFETNGSASDAQARNAARPQAPGQRQGLVDTFA